MEDRYKDYRVKPVECTSCDEKKIEVVSDMYEKIAKDIFGNNYINDDSFEDSCIHMCKIEKLLYSKKGIKKGVLL